MLASIIDRIHSPTMLFKHGVFYTLSKSFNTYFQFTNSDFSNQSILNVAKFLFGENFDSTDDLKMKHQSFHYVEAKNGLIHKTLFYYSNLQADNDVYHLFEFKVDEDFANLEYARDVQKTILPDPARLKKKVNLFIYERPQYIVSGDFIWFYTHKDYTLVAVGDSMGHGVSAGIISTVGVNILNDVISKHRDEDLVYVVEDVSLKMLYFMNKPKHSISEESIDIAFCKIYHKEGIVEYVGARRPIYFYKNGEIIRFKPDKTSLGQSYSKERKKHIISFQKGDRLYLFSDGVVDQFDEKDEDKFGYRRLKELIKQTSPCSIEEQGEIINIVLDEWKGGGYQIDDMLLLGIEL